MFREEMLARIDALEHRAEQNLDVHQVILLIEMTCVASDALENQRTLVLSEADVELQRHQRARVMDIFKNISRKFNTICLKFSIKVKGSMSQVEKKLII